MLRKALSESLGTYALVFAGTGAIIIDDVSGGAITHVGVALTFGLIIMTMIYAFGDVSGAHFNPAVSIAFAASGRFSLRQLPLYIVAQLAGAFAASATLRLLFPLHATLGTTLPATPGLVQQAFWLEAILTFFLMLVILRVSTGSREQGLMAGIAIGGVVGLEAMFAGPICGASMNPARSLAPAILSGHTEYLYAYLIAPTLGALAAVPVWLILKAPAERPTPA